jgi:hypothetical protein
MKIKLLKFSEIELQIELKKLIGELPQKKKNYPEECHKQFEDEIRTVANELRKRKNNR